MDHLHLRHVRRQHKWNIAFLLNNLRGYDEVDQQQEHDIERLVVDPIEDALNELDDIKRMDSRSLDGVGVIQPEFHWNTDVGPEATPTYAVANIDHVASNHFQGGCWHPGVTDGRPAVTDIVFFDHKPAVCELFVP